MNWVVPILTLYRLYWFCSVMRRWRCWGRGWPHLQPWHVIAFCSSAGLPGLIPCSGFSLGQWHWVLCIWVFQFAPLSEAAHTCFGPMQTSVVSWGCACLHRAERFSVLSKCHDYESRTKVGNMPVERLLSFAGSLLCILQERVWHFKPSCDSRVYFS